MVRSKAVSAETSSAGNVAVAAVRPTVVEEITVVRSTHTVYMYIQLVYI